MEHKKLAFVTKYGCSRLASRRESLDRRHSAVLDQARTERYAHRCFCPLLSVFCNSGARLAPRLITRLQTECCFLKGVLGLDSRLTRTGKRLTWDLFSRVAV